MIDEFSWLLSQYSERQSLPTICQKDSNQQEPTAISGTTTKSIANSLENDILVLSKIYEFSPGKVIELPLDYACTLLGRTRHRVDAFAKLQKYLMKEYQTELKITSRKTH